MIGCGVIAFDSIGCDLIEYSVIGHDLAADMTKLKYSHILHWDSQ